MFLSPQLIKLLLSKISILDRTSYSQVKNSTDSERELDNSFLQKVLGLCGQLILRTDMMMAVEVFNLMESIHSSLLRPRMQESTSESISTTLTLNPLLSNITKTELLLFLMLL